MKLKISITNQDSEILDQFEIENVSCFSEEHLSNKIKDHLDSTPQFTIIDDI